MAAGDDSVVNSNAYWNRRFRENWIASSGREQTAFFALMAMEAFPGWFRDHLSEPGRSICDMGCALGEASDLLARAFPEAVVTGVDFSEEAIASARKDYSHVRFETGDIATYATAHDVFFCSNTLEHFTDPRPLIEQLCRAARNYVVVVVPLWDPPGTIPEHQVLFDDSMFSRLVPAWMRLAHGVIIDCRRLPQSRWQGYQGIMILERIAEPLPAILEAMQPPSSGT